MNKNGFTLVEVLAVLTILGVVMVLAIPGLLNVLGDSKGKISEYELANLIDAGKYYLIDIDEGSANLVYDGEKQTTINNHTYSKGDLFSRYDARTYLIENGGVIITPEILIHGGYYNKECHYEGDTIIYKDNGVEKTSVASKDIDCKIPKTCKIKLSIIGHKVKNDLYYVTDDYKVELLEGCE